MWSKKVKKFHALLCILGKVENLDVSAQQLELIGQVEELLEQVDGLGKEAGTLGRPILELAQTQQKAGIAARLGVEQCDRLF
jgi:hypothetical protein